MGDNNLKYARKAELTKINARIEFDKYIDHAIKLLKDYQDITHLYIEKNTFNGADANAIENKINDDPMLRNRSITIINEHQKKNKDDKISTLIPYINKGQIILLRKIVNLRTRYWILEGRSTAFTMMLQI